MTDISVPRKTKKARVSRDQIVKNLVDLGIIEGDIIYVRAAIWSVGRLAGPASEIFLGGLLDAVGPTGTVVGPAFNKVLPLWKKAPVFDQDTKPYTGLLSECMLGHPEAVRSDHPTHSMVAIGAHATDLMADHSPQTACFDPIRKIMKARGKQVLIGCVEDSPGFPTGHLAQFDLGLTKKHYVRFLLRARYLDSDGSTHSFRPIEAPGCSNGFHRFYADHVIADNLRIGRVGAALSICTCASEAYKAEYAALARDPKYGFCDNPVCLGCRVFNGYNLLASPLAATRLVLKTLNTKVLKR